MATAIEIKGFKTAPDTARQRKDASALMYSDVVTVTAGLRYVAVTCHAAQP
jgi:hypothetical protein